MKSVVLGITGGVAAYKALDIVSILKKADIDVDCVMTESAMEFVRPLSFQSLSQNPVITDMFEEPKVWEIAHISLAKKTDCVLIAPCTANVIAKLAHGIADDFLTTMCLATKARIVIAPAMNTGMLENSVTQENMETLRRRGITVLGTGAGRLACGDVGAGKLLPPDEIAQEVLNILKDIPDKGKDSDSDSDSNNNNELKEQDMKGIRVLITAGPTSAPIDPVRLLTNRSSGKTGYAIAEEARDRGAQVTLISGTRSLPDIEGIRTEHILTNEEMYEACHRYFPETDVVIMSAAVADYRIKDYSEEKIKKRGDELNLTFVRDRDILKSLGEAKNDQILVGFAAESQNIRENAEKKFLSKNLDLIVYNDISGDKVFGKDTTTVTVMRRDEKGDIKERTFSQIPKTDAAEGILDELMDYMKTKDR